MADPFPDASTCPSCSCTWQQFVAEGHASWCARKGEPFLPKPPLGATPAAMRDLSVGASVEGSFAPVESKLTAGPASPAVLHDTGFVVRAKREAVGSVQHDCEVNRLDVTKFGDSRRRFMCRICSTLSEGEPLGAQVSARPMVDAHATAVADAVREGRDPASVETVNRDRLAPLITLAATPGPGDSPQPPDDVIVLRTTTDFGFIDRLRILFGRPLKIRSEVSVWFPTPTTPFTRATTVSMPFVPPIFPPRPVHLMRSPAGAQDTVEQRAS